MEVRNSAAESQSSDQSQPIPETEGDGRSEMIGGPMDVVAAATDASGGGGAVEVELGSGGGGIEMAKKKRGRPSRVQARSPPTKIIKEEDEDVCFICFDGGSLVLCDRRGCPKAYHPACVKRDDDFFKSKARWNCGWHICSLCEKAAHHMCYTCTYSLCKGCVKTADYVCVRGDKGFCTVCMKTVMLFENNGQGKDDKAQVDFDDKTSWEYLFKVYWTYLKDKLSLTLDELIEAKNPWKGDNTSSSVSPPTCVHNGGNNLNPKNLETNQSKRRKTDELVNIPHKELTSSKCKDWATKELLEFVAHMKNGDISVLSQFDVQELMLEYIKRNNLRDPRKKSQIICDSRLKILFGKPRVGHFEMLKLLEFHFLIKEEQPKNTVNNISRQLDPDWNNNDTMVTVSKDKKRRNHRKIEERVPQNNLDEFAAIDVHNMNLVYLRRKLMENLIDESEEFHGKVVGSVVRIRISGSDQKHDMYRLVQVVGTSKADAPYKIGNKSINVVLEVLNLDKKETVSVDTISNQDLSEDECRRLRQSIKCGLVKRFTVGEIQDKAVSLQSVRLNDWMEAETLRLNNLRDRASEKGHKKGLREYVERLQLLKTPEERERRLREIPEVHSDPKMNPDYETDDTEEYFNKEPGEHTKPKYSGINRKNTNSPKKIADFSSKIGSRSLRHVTKEGSTKAHGLSSSGRPLNQVDCNGLNHQTTGPSSETATSSFSIRNTPVRVSNDGEMDKIWHYRDPSGKIQGPFCMIQLQKWSTTGYFPVDMRIWMNREDESLLLNDVLNKTTDKKRGTIRIEQLTVRTANLLSDGHGSSSQSNPNPNSNPLRLNESIGQFNAPELASPTPVANNGDMKHFDIADASMVDLPSPTPKKMNEKDVKVQNGGDNGRSMSSSEVLPSPTPKKMNDEDEKVQNGELLVQLPKTAEEWGGYSGGVTALAVEEGGGAATTTTSIPSSLPPSSHPVYETIEFSTLAEESVSDLLAEVDAMESQNGYPSPTSRRNSFVEDLFNGSFEEFSPTPHQSTATAATTQGNNGNVFDLLPEQKPTLELVIQASQSTEPKGRTTHIEAAPPPPPPPLSLTIGLHNVYPQRVGSEPMQCNFNNLERPVQEMTTRVNSNLPGGRGGNVGWDPQMYGGKRYNNNSNNNNNVNNNNSQRDLGYGRGSQPSWGRQSTFGSGGGGGVSGGGYSRPPPKGQRVCKFFESGRCKKGASCNYWHP